MKNRYIAASLMAVVSLMNCNLQAKDDFSENYNYKRAIEFWNDDKENAKNWLQREIESTPQNYLAFYRIAALYRMEGDMKKAIDASSQAVTLMKKDVEMQSYAYLERAMEYCLSADTTSALSDLSVGIRLNPKNGDLYEKYGGILIDVQRFFEAKIYIEKGIGMNPTSPDGYNNLGRLACATGDLDESVFQYNNSIKYCGPNTWAYIGRSEALIKLNKLGDAVSDVLEALAMEKSNAKALSLLQQLADKSYKLVQIKLKARRLQDASNSLWSELTEKVKAHKESGADLYDKTASLNAPSKDYMLRFIESAASEKKAVAPKVEIPGGTLYQEPLLTKNSKKVEPKDYLNKTAKDEVVLSPEHVTPYGLSVAWEH